MNQKTPIDEADQFIQDLHRESSQPDEKFRHALKQKMLRRLSAGPVRSWFIHISEKVQNMATIPSVRPTGLIGRVALAGLAVIVIGGAGYFAWENQNAGKKNGTSILSATDRDRILSRLANSSTLSAAGAGERVTSGDESQALMATDKALAPEYYQMDRDYTYSSNKTTNTAGPAADRCPSMASSGSGDYESYEYISGDDWYSKNVSYDADGNLDSYYLYLPDGSLEYKGGSFAIKTLHTQQYKTMEDTSFVPSESEGETSSASAGEGSDSQPDRAESSDSATVNTSTLTLEDTVTPEPDQTDQDAIRSMFGEDAQVEEVVEDGTVVRYIVTWSYQTTCVYPDSGSDTISRTMTESLEIAPSQGEDTVINKMWVDAETYASEKQEYYLGSESAENLILSVQTESDYQDIPFAQVEDVFTFEYPVEIKTIDPSLYQFDPWNDQADRQEYIQKAIAYLQENAIRILTPTSTEVEVSNLYVPTAYETEDPYRDLYLDRTFYPAGAKGDTMYEDAQSMYNPSDEYSASSPVVQEDFSSVDTTRYIAFSLSVFAAGTSAEELLSSFIGAFEDMYTAADTSVTIDDTAIPARTYTITMEDKPVPMPLLLEDSVEGSDSAETPPALEAPDTESIPNQMQYIIFTYTDHLYIINLSQMGYDWDLSRFYSFDAYDPSDSAGMDQITSLITAGFEYNQRQMVEGSSGGGVLYDYVVIE